MVAYALMMGGTALTVLLAGIIGTRFAPSEGLATLPIALTIVGVASSTLPTGRLQERFGRRTVFLAYGLLAIAAALGSALSLALESFWAYCLSAFMMGWAAAASHQYRFAALEMVPAEKAAAATSVLLLGGILGAFLGPEMAVAGRYLLPTEFAGSYLLLTMGYMAGIAIVWFYREHNETGEHDLQGGRPLGEILRQPVIVLAIGSAAVAYGLMSFLMTATPISMHEHSGHSLEATKWVIQSHIAAMYLPSLFFAVLLRRLGFRGMLWLGTGAYLLVLATALSGTALVHYWLAMVLLGVGWNFLFLCGTNLLPLGYRRSERFRVQAFNDFLTFSVQAMVSLGSGWFLYLFQWQGVVWAGLAPVVLYILLLMTSRGLDKATWR
jgi:MFS family permease